MKAVVSSIKLHTSVWIHLLALSLKQLLEHRVNTVVSLFYSSTYYAMQYTVLLLVFAQTPRIGGWEKAEVLLLFGIFQLVLTIANATFMTGIMLFMRNGIATGDFDRVLTKPINHIFLVAFGSPDLATLVFCVPSLYIIFTQAALANIAISYQHLVGFAIITFLCLCSTYFILVTYATAAFFVTRSQQLFHTFEKVMDFAQYPLHIFPQGLQLIFFSFFPLALLGYVPTLYMLQKIDLAILPTLVAGCLILLLISNFVWSEALKYYSSASS